MNTAAIYLPKDAGRDAHFHARSECHFGGIRIQERGKYVVGTPANAIEAGRKPCPGCWTLQGYVVPALVEVNA